VSDKKMIVKAKEYQQRWLVSAFGALTFVTLPTGFITMMLHQEPFIGAATAAATVLLSPIVYKGISGDIMQDHIPGEFNKGAYSLSPTFREKRELVSRDGNTGTETYMVRTFSKIIIETHTPENPGKTWDRVYESLLKVHDLKETDFLVYAEIEDSSKEGSHGKLLPWKHSINKAMAFTGYGIACECKACSR
jgi:hypothetical protein